MRKFDLIFVPILLPTIVCCSSAPAVVTSFDETCEIVQSPIHAVTMNESVALTDMKKQTLSLNGDTLLFGESGLSEIRNYNERREKERWLNTPMNERKYAIDCGTAYGVKRPGESEQVFWGAVLNCGK